MFLFEHVFCLLNVGMKKKICSSQKRARTKQINELTEANKLFWENVATSSWVIIIRIFQREPHKMMVFVHWFKRLYLWLWSVWDMFHTIRHPINVHTYEHVNQDGDRDRQWWGRKVEQHGMILWLGWHLLQIDIYREIKETPSDVERWCLKIAYARPQFILGSYPSCAPPVDYRSQTTLKSHFVSNFRVFFSLFLWTLYVLICIKLFS